MVEVDKALVAKEKEGRKVEVKELSMLVMQEEEGCERKGSKDKLWCIGGQPLGHPSVQRSSSAKGQLTVHLSVHTPVREIIAS